MKRGSGIATYAFNLNLCLNDLGYRTEILYGPERIGGKDRLLSEIALFDAAPIASASKPIGAALRLLARLTAPLGRRARRITPSGEVITRQMARHVPPCEGLWLSKDVFHAANRAHATWGRITPLRLEDAEHGRPDIMHWTCPLPLRAVGMPNLYTIHDLVPLRLPFATLDNKRRFLKLCGQIRGTADQVVTVSEHSRQDIVRILGVDEARVTVTHQCVDLPVAITSRPEDEVAREVAGVFGLDWKGYFLFFGAIEPKKNLARVIEAYLASGTAAPLVIIGGAAWLDEDETRMIYGDLVEVSALRDGMIRRADRIRRYEYLPFSLLVSLIRGARATLLPSLYEGFGLPVLESMLLRTPVLASTAGSLPEVAGEAALLVDPYDTQAIRRAIEALDRDGDLRAELSERGARQAAKFSPEVYRQRLADLYKPFG